MANAQVHLDFVKNERSGMRIVLDDHIFEATASTPWIRRKVQSTGLTNASRNITKIFTA